MSKEIKIITPELLRTWGPCSDGYKRFCELFPEGADLKTAVDGLVNDGHPSWGEWLFGACRSRGLFAEYVAHGFMNAGDMNAGNRNAGNRNAGDMNVGNRNAGNWNAGNRNAGDWNAGDWNAGDWNAGDMNAGNMNAGDMNAGNRNAGNRNAGDWNAGDCNAGYFNASTPEFITVFDKPCSSKDWEDAYKPYFLFFDLTVWVYESNMTDEEKAKNPKFYVAGGYLKTLDYKEAFKASWENADKKDRERVRELPNFDAEIFFKISGIDLRDKGNV